MHMRRKHARLHAYDAETNRLFAVMAGGADDEGDLDDDGGDGGVEEPVVTLSKKDADALRSAASKGAKATKEALDLRRELALAKAGVNLESKAGQLLARTLEPDENGQFDVEAIRADAEELGAIVPTGTAPPEQGDEEDSTEMRQQLASGSEAGHGAVDEGPDPYDEAKAARQASLDAGSKREVADAAYVESVFRAASEGDGRVEVEVDAPALTR
jgi:hypothetical protein